MRPLQAEIIKKLHVHPTIDPATEIERRVTFLTDYARSVNPQAFILTVNGAQDSALAGRLAQLAAERLRTTGTQTHLVTVLLPHSPTEDQTLGHSDEAAQASLDFIEPDERLTFNATPALDAVAAEHEHTFDSALSPFARANARARLRTLVRFLIAGERHGLVIGTDHATEAVSGYFTKYGDGSADLAPLAGLTRSQISDQLRHLKAPESLYADAPTADVLDARPGRTDEDSLGFGYDTVDAYLRGEEVPEQAAETIEARARSTEHKRRGPIRPSDDWWKNADARWTR